MALFGKYKTDYFDNLEQFLQCAIQENIKLNLRKISFDWWSLHISSTVLLRMVK